MSSKSDTAQALQLPALRPPSQVMKLARLGAFFPTRLSFLGTLLRDLAAQQAQPRRTRWEIDESGFGRAVYTIRLDGREGVATSVVLPVMRTSRSQAMVEYR